MIKSKLRPLARAVKRTDLFWRYGSNFQSTMSFRRHRRSLSQVQQRLLGELDENGVAITTFDELFADPTAWSGLELAAADLLDKKKNDITALKVNAGVEAIGQKTFNLECLGSEVTLDTESIFAKLALNHALVAVADEYLGMYARLRYYNVWYTAASGSTPRESQLWHFDREDNYILKVFLYLDDVDAGTGPFTYAPKTHRRGIHRSVQPEYTLEGGVKRTTDEQMDKVVPRMDWVIGTGGKGTLILADTRGYHKGGEARTRDRVMYTCMFTSPASESQQLLHIPVDFNPGAMSASQLRALGRC